jgi:hypothetical protein
MIRQIKPHKGNRRERIEARVTTVTRGQLMEIIASIHTQTGKEISIADWLTVRIAEEYAKLPKRDAISTKIDAINA